MLVEWPEEKMHVYRALQVFSLIYNESPAVTLADIVEEHLSSVSDNTEVFSELFRKDCLKIQEKEVKQ